MSDAADANRLRSPFSLTGRTALVTGAGRGLGFEMAKALAMAGAQVVINGRDPSRLQTAAQAIAQASGRECGVLAFDVSDAVAAKAGIEEMARRFGGPDILVNNVGARDRRSLAQFTPEEAAALIGTDLIGPMVLAKAAIPAMAARGHGRLIFVTSIAGHVANRDDPVYTAAKAGLTGLMRALAVDHARAGITSNAIAPGMFATQTNAALVQDPALVPFVEMRVPEGRWGRPHEIGAAAVFLASDEASFVNGHVLVVDGGQTIRM